jgi:hypothetical protein
MSRSKAIFFLGSNATISHCYAYAMPSFGGPQKHPYVSGVFICPNDLSLWWRIKAAWRLIFMVPEELRKRAASSGEQH